MGIFYELSREIKKTLKSDTIKIEILKQLPQGIAVLLGAVTAYALSIDLGLGAVAASAAVGLIAALVSPKYAAAVYCGSFVGMASPFVFSQYWEILLAGVLGGIVFILVLNIFLGYGGKLGTIAFVSSSSTLWILKSSFISGQRPDFTFTFILFSLLFSILSLFLTVWISIHLKKGPVLGSSLVSLLGVLIFAFIRIPTYGDIYALIIMTASFSGMVSSERIKGLIPLTFVGIVTAIVYLCSISILSGAGGKLGTIALGSVVGTIGLERILSGTVSILKNR